MPPHSFIFALILIAAASVTQARAQEQRSFTHWTASCADARCIAETVTPGGRVTLRFTLEDAPDARWEISLTDIQKDIKPGTPVEFTVDGGGPMGFPEGSYSLEEDRLVLSDPQQETALFATLERGDQARLTFSHQAGFPIRLNFSLAGLGAAVQWIEERGGGPAPSAANAPPKPEEAPPAEQSAAAPAEAAPDPEPAEVPDIVSERHLADGECKDYDAEHMKTARVAGKLDAHHTLYLLPCFNGAYNSVYRVWITDSRYPDEVERSLFAGYSDEQGWYGKDILINADYDAATKTLSAFEKSRGLGDCGSVPTYRWHEENWRLMEYRYWGECDGSRQAETWPAIFQHPDYKGP